MEDLPQEISCVKVSNNLLRLTSAKTILLICYLRLYANIDGWINFSFNFLMNKLGYSPNTRNGRINQQFIEIIEELKRQNAVLYYDGPGSHGECHSLRINNKNEIIFDPKSNYALLTVHEFNKIIEMKHRNPEKLLAVYLCVKRYCSSPGDELPRYFTGSLLNIKDNLSFCLKNSISEKTISSLLDDMVEAGLLNRRAGKFINQNGNFIQTPGHYAAMGVEIDPEISDQLFLAHYGTLLDED